MRCYIKKNDANRNKIYFNDEDNTLFIRRKSISSSKGKINRYKTKKVDAENINNLENNAQLEILIKILDQKHGLIFERNNIVNKQSCKLKNNSEDKLIFPNVIKNDYTEKTLKKCCLKNNKIYTTLLWELIHYFYYTNREEYTTAFIHLYRMLEYLTFAAPIIYMKKSQSFINAYKSMKDLFSDSKDRGEIRFFKDFLNKTINCDQGVTDEQGKRIDSDNEISSDIFLDEETYAKLKKGVNNLIGNNNLMEFDDDDKKFSIKCYDIMDSFITIRNKTFHDKIDYKNKVNKEILLDEIFEVLNKVYINWIEYIVNYSIKEDYKMNEKKK